MGFGEGAFGGSILSYRKAGLLAGNAAVKIMKGTDPLSIKVSENDYYEYLLDWRQLRKFKLEKLAGGVKESVVRYREMTFLSKYKWPISGAIVFLILQSLMIASLVRLNRKQKMMTRRIVEADRKYIDIIREDRILRMGMLTASLSHELNQPLTAILSTAQAGTKFIEADNRDPNLLKELFQNIAEDNNRAASILKSIKGMMKMEKREKEKVNLNDLILEVTDLYHSKAIEMNSTLNISLLPEPVFVLGDAIQIQQVLMNLISNASHSMEKSNGNPRTVIIKETLENGHVSISVRDYGKGIEESLRSKLFEPFITSKRDGVGIGLSLSRLIIEDHGGKIRARNMPDSGAEFTFSLKIFDERGN
jgi:C4-dicarboxylate-specific signal transduction histidine kinase